MGLIRKGKKQMKNRKRFIKILAVIAALEVIFVIGILVFYKTPQKVKDTPLIQIDEYDKSELEVYQFTYQREIDSIYNMGYQKNIRKKLDFLIQENSYTFDEPLAVLNPFGTNTTSLYLYFNTKEMSKIEYTIKVKDDTISDFKETLYNGEKNGLTNIHEYQLIGLIPNMENEVELRLLDQNDKVIDKKSFTITMGSLLAENTSHMEIKEGDSKVPLENGLYALLGHDKSFSANIYLYDNDGIIRSEIPLNSYRTDRILFIYDWMVYSYTDQDIAIVNRLGEVLRTYHLDDYQMHHDFMYHEDTEQLIILANELETDTIEDVVVALDLVSGDVTKILDFKKIMQDIYETGIQPEGGNTYGGDELDWIHFNSLDFINKNDMILSSRELSTLIRVNNVFEQPTIEYLIADESLWEDTNYEEYLYTKVGDFVSQAGQHTIQYKTDESLEKGQYYLYMFNNNYTKSRTRPFLDWSAFSGTGTYLKGDHSMYYQYLVDERKKTYTLVKSIELPYSSIVSSVQDVGENIVTSSGMHNCYNEYDKDGKLIREFNYLADKYAYRVFKYKFQDFWFQ